jgi:glucose/arabinose dehydrogenase
MRRIVLFLIIVLAAGLQPARAADGSRTFPETGYTVTGRLLDFWDGNGGLPVFGYPVSEERQERTPEGQFAVQHFERQRFERHPTTAAPYDVLLGRLGDELLARSGRNWQNEPAGTPHPGCQFFDETHHTLCEPFLSYWRNHGLLDPRLNAFQRSLALFGFPLTEPAMELNSSGDRVLTQWFERARFEYHPDKPAPFQVLLGRLGADEYDPANSAGPTIYHTVELPAIGHSLEVPIGFTIEVIASDLGRPRFTTMDSAGNLYVGEVAGGRVLRLQPTLPATGEPGHFGPPQVVADGFAQPHSVALVNDQLIVADETQVVRLTDLDGSGHARQRQVIIPDLPSGATDLYGHRTRTLIPGPDGKMYLSIGSSCDVCVENDPRRATVMRFNTDGSGGEIFARGLRNSVGIAFRPGTNELWGMDMGRNLLGDDRPPEELNLLQQGKDYGWPYCYGNREPNPEFNDPARCATTEVPLWTLRPHTAPLGLNFYDKLQFPPSYQGDAIVGVHGSSELAQLQGYNVLRIHFQDGKPVRQEDLVRGWLVDGKWWGRPVDVLVANDGSLIISDDGGGRLYRLRYTGDGG